MPSILKEKTPQYPARCPIPTLDDDRLFFIVDSAQQCLAHSCSFLHSPKDILQALITAPENTAVVTQIPFQSLVRGEIRSVPPLAHEPLLTFFCTKVRSIALLNPVDALYVTHPADKPSRVIGNDIAGAVDKLGDGVSRRSVGDRVASFVQGAMTGINRPGDFSEYVILVKEHLATSIPSQVSFDEAATVPLCA
ncbi:zinc-binding oxidoreductase [Moniliophthora roreri MCA 2997]|uniref:Zinc-binding oxidoreductase n=1 Tax=Moniliophthora roreri (strain MCA 2997) TaxID=1381753 RepID=V2WBX6_MONRO|nr:zinc-binding oxidoreductase [Moniliophthora roreri MCA 2997]